jgi:hypothetical protein
MSIITKSCKINFSEDPYRSQLTSFGQSRRETRKRTFRNVIGSILSAVNPSIKNRKGIELIDKKQKDYRIGAFILSLTSVAKCRPVLTSIEIKTKVNRFHNSLLTQYILESHKRCSYNLSKSRGRPFITDIIPRFNHTQFLGLFSQVVKTESSFLRYSIDVYIRYIAVNHRTRQSTAGDCKMSNKSFFIAEEAPTQIARLYVQPQQSARVKGAHKPLSTKTKGSKVAAETGIDRGVSSSYVVCRETTSPNTTTIEEVAPNSFSSNDNINSSKRKNQAGTRNKVTTKQCVVNAVDKVPVSKVRLTSETGLIEGYMRLKASLGRYPTLGELADAGFSREEVDLMETFSDWVRSSDLEEWEPLSQVAA